uniref:Uncharacterized protein n=1 Tax=Leersia perrieri TaxID=77586 RepID=A0A0D9UZK9_9ORYZ
MDASNYNIKDHPNQNNNKLFILYDLEAQTAKGLVLQTKNINKNALIAIDRTRSSDSQGFGRQIQVSETLVHKKLLITAPTSGTKRNRRPTKMKSNLAKRNQN